MNTNVQGESPGGARRERRAGPGDRRAGLDNMLARLAYLNQVGVALSREKDIDRLLESILIAAQAIANADCGTLYRVSEDRQSLRFEIIRTDSLDVAFGGSTGRPVPVPPIPLFDPAGAPNTHNVSACAVIQDRTFNIEDAYTADGFDFSGTRRFDQANGYRSKSFLTVPMKNHEEEIIGVLQLINAQDRVTGEVRAFTADDQQLAESLASQAAVALTNRLLISHLENLFESFINLINSAIDDKSPYTGGHCERVPVLTMMLAEAACGRSEGPLAGFSMNEQQRYELKIAGLLHDCGKVTTPVHVVDKATKLETIFDRIHLIDTRFEVVRRSIEVDLLRERLDAMRRGERANLVDMDAELKRRVRELNDDRDFLRKVNIGGEFMPPQDQERVHAIAQRWSWQDEEGFDKPLLTADEIANLTIARGTLTPEERNVINHHIEVTIQMLEALPWPKHLKNVPEFAGGHHERIDGKGYPRGLTGAQMSVQARVMAIADVFEALTAKDRPYKPGKTLTEALTILGRMAQTGHVDPDLFRVFVQEKVYLRYAEAFLDAEQIDAVDESQIPGYRAGVA
jgi:HD-GYP domain-containing protein (c-di-GMP phosphodiesterase class II)